MANLEWEAPHDLVGAGGTVLLNQPDPTTGRTFQILPQGYKMGPTLRVTTDNLSEADGSVLHPRWKTGMAAAMTVRFQINPGGGPDFEPACGQDLREMNEDLTRVLNSMRRFTGAEQQRLLWTPTADPAISRRMLDDVQVLAWPDPTFDEGTLSQQATFALECPFPYAIDLTQVETDIADGATATLTNDGTSDFMPVAKIPGPFIGFVLTNTTTGLELSYDGTRPGAAPVGPTDYAEIDFFRGTVFLNGDSTDLIAGIDPEVTDFFPLVYLSAGANDITITGADAQVLWNRAWS